MSTLIAFKWAVLYENVICTATFFSYLNVVRKWEVKMNCCFYWSWKPSSCWSNETGNDSLSKTITQPHFFFHWLLVKTGLKKKKAIKADLEVPTATVLRSQEKSKSGERMGICRMKWNMKQSTGDELSCLLISPSLHESGQRAFSKLSVDEETCSRVIS